MPVIYKILFEVKLLHEFYLTRPDGSTIFELANQGERLNFLLEEFTNGNESINSDLSYEFHERVRKEYEGYGLKLIPAYSGFKVAARVNQLELADNSIVYKPFFPLPENYCINITIRKRDQLIDSYSNGLISDSLPAIYLFSTEQISVPKVFPNLSHPVPPFNATYDYEQGELASFGANDLRSYYHDGAGDQFDSFIGNAFATNNDALLLPLRFNYFFVPGSNVRNAVFSLKDTNGTEVSSKEFNSAARFSKLSLDFSSISDLLNLPGTSFSANSIFSLQVTGDDGYSRNHPVLFSNDFCDNSWALVSIRSNPENPDFKLIANDGFLVKRRNPLGIWTEAPIFEIPLKSRFTYWRFINNRGKKLELVPDLQDYVDLEDGILLTKRPRSIARYFFLLKKAGSTDTKYVPNPVDFALVKDNIERICFDVVVPESPLFHPAP
jgi:hypothetical protein